MIPIPLCELSIPQSYSSHLPSSTAWGKKPVCRTQPILTQNPEDKLEQDPSRETDPWLKTNWTHPGPLLTNQRFLCLPTSSTQGPSSQAVWSVSGTGWQITPRSLLRPLSWTNSFTVQMVDAAAKTWLICGAYPTNNLLLGKFEKLVLKQMEGQLT